MKIRNALLIPVVLWVAYASPAIAEMKSIVPQAAAGDAQAVILDACPLVFTEQLLPVGATGHIKQDIGEQIGDLYDLLNQTLAAAGTSLGRTAKLNFYVTSDEVAKAVREQLANRPTGAVLPAVSFVQTRLPNSRAVVAVDAVACTTAEPARRYLETKLLDAQANQGSRPGLSQKGHLREHFSIAGAGPGVFPLVYISGDAKPGELPEATKATLESLDATMKSLSLQRRDVLQVKCFLQPMAHAIEVRRAIDAFFSPGATPPVVMVEWTMKSPIEIELVVFDRSGAMMSRSTDSVEFSTPPGMKPSPVFSRVARVHSDKLIFFSGLYAAESGDGASEVTSIFDQLGKLLPQTGSNFQNLAKATYYVSDEDASDQLNALRPKYYDPARPPAASKAPVTGVAMPGRTITLDMIAVPTATIPENKK